MWVSSVLSGKKSLLGYSISWEANLEVGAGFTRTSVLKNKYGINLCFKKIFLELLQNNRNQTISLVTLPSVLSREEGSLPDCWQCCSSVAQDDAGICKRIFVASVQIVGTLRYFSAKLLPGCLQVCSHAWGSAFTCRGLCTYLWASWDCCLPIFFSSSRYFWVPVQPSGLWIASLVFLLPVN